MGTKYLAVGDTAMESAGALLEPALPLCVWCRPHLLLEFPMLRPVHAALAIIVMCTIGTGTDRSHSRIPRRVRRCSPGLPGTRYGRVSRPRRASGGAAAQPRRGLVRARIRLRAQGRHRQGDRDPPQVRCAGLLRGRSPPTPTSPGCAAAPGFAEVRRALEVNRRPVVKSTVAFTLPERDLLTEGIAYDPRTRAFFVGSVHRRKIVRVDRYRTCDRISSPPSVTGSGRHLVCESIRNEESCGWQRLRSRRCSTMTPPGRAEWALSI